MPFSILPVGPSTWKTGAYTRTGVKTEVKAFLASPRQSYPHSVALDCAQGNTEDLWCPQVQGDHH
jgi:hypothetical protein